MFGGSLTGNTNGLLTCSGNIRNVVFGTNTRDINTSVFSAYNVTFGVTTENLNYGLLAKESYSESVDHDATAGAFKSWTKGGVTTKQTTTYPAGKTYSMQLVLADAANEGFWQREVTVGAGASINITSYLRKSASMAYLPRVIIFNKASTDPFAGGTGLDTFTMTDSVDTFESDTYTYYNSTSEDVTIVIRTQGKNASGNVFSLIEVEQINVDLTTLINNLATVDTVVDAIKAKTDNLPSDPADESLLEAAITAAIPSVPTVTQIRQEMDTNSTRLATIATDTTTDIPALIAALDTDSVMSATVEGTITLKQALMVMLAELAGKVTGGGTATITYRNPGDDKDRVILTVDEKGNRTVVTTDLT